MKRLILAAVVLAAPLGAYAQRTDAPDHALSDRMTTPTADNAFTGVGELYWKSLDSRYGAHHGGDFSSRDHGSTAGSGGATSDPDRTFPTGGYGYPVSHGTGPATAVAAPELDGSLGIGAFTLLVGGALVLKSRRVTVRSR
jgi:hypothetical protein